MIIQFYEKPGCINNTRQKLLLESFGYTVITSATAPLNRVVALKE